MDDDRRETSGRRTVDRRRLLRSMGSGVAAAVAYGALGRAMNAFAAGPANKAFVVTTVNHLSYASPDYKVARDFYVGFFGMRDVWDDGTKCQLDCGPEDAPNSLYLTGAKPGVAPAVEHFAFGLPDYWKVAGGLKEELLRRALPGVRPDG